MPAPRYVPAHPPLPAPLRFADRRPGTQVQEISLDYTRCRTEAPSFDDRFDQMPADRVQTAFKSSNKSIEAQWAVEQGVNVTLPSGVSIPTDRCYLRFNIPENMGPPVLFYYTLTNFYQNHRRYVESSDQQQLKGDARSYDDIRASKCIPLFGEDAGGVMKPYYPCGLIANSMFNDSFTSPELLNPPGARDNQTRPYNMTTSGIAWNSDKALYGPTSYSFSDVLPPPNWRVRYPDNYTEGNPPPNLQEWEAFQVWMRTAGLPTFSKLYQRNDKEAMEDGRYQIIIDDRE